MKMVHVTFNEKVECHQYSPTHPEEIQSNNRNDDISHPAGVTSSQSRLKYNIRFLKNLQNGPLSQACPDIVKKGIEEKQGWTGTEPLPPSKAFSKRGNIYGQRPIINPNSVFNRPMNHQNKPPHSLVPFYNNNHYFGGGPLEPIGGSRYTPQSRNPFYNRNSMQDYSDNHTLNRNLYPEHRSTSSDMKKTYEEADEPQWITHGPTSPNDCVDLHGFEGPLSKENQDIYYKDDQLGCVDGNTSGGPTSGTSSSNDSPPAKSTPAKVTLTSLNDTQRHKRPAVGRSNNWQNNFDNHRRANGAPFLNEFFKNFSGAQNQANLRGLTPLVSVEDVESSLLYDRLKFRQMVAQMHAHTPVCRNRNLVNPQQEPIPTAKQILSEIDKILQSGTDPVYKRPEVRALIKNIVEAVIPPMNIFNILKNPLTEPQNVETIQSALKIITQAKQNATNAMKQTHKPTESELRAHMDAIMQDAILKKRMENLSNELLKGSYQQGGRFFPPNQSQSFHQLFRQNNAGRFENHSQSETRGHCQSVENGITLAQENYLNRWFSPTLLHKGMTGELPQIPNDPLRSEELESTIKQKFMGNEKEVK